MSVSTLQTRWGRTEVCEVEDGGMVVVGRIAREVDRAIHPSSHEVEAVPEVTQQALAQVAFSETIGS